MSAYRRVDDFTVTCGLTASTPRSALGPTLSNEYGKPLPFYSFVDLERMKGCVGLVGWPYSGRFTHISGHPSRAVRLQVERRARKVRRSQPKFYHCATYGGTACLVESIGSPLPGSLLMPPACCLPSEPEICTGPYGCWEIMSVFLP